MVAFFHYSPIDILTVHLPSPVLEFYGLSKQEWMKREVEELKCKMESFYAEVSDVLRAIEQKSMVSRNASMDSVDLHKHILEFKDILDKESNQYYDLLQATMDDDFHLAKRSIDILEINRLRRFLVVGSHTWDRRLYSLDCLLNSGSSKLEGLGDTRPHSELKELKNGPVKDSKFVGNHAEIEGFTESHLLDYPTSVSFRSSLQEEVYGDVEVTVSEKSSETLHSQASNLSDKIDSAWTGTDVDASEDVPVTPVNLAENLPLKRLIGPARVYSFDSAMRLEENLLRRLHSTSQLSAVRSFHGSGDYRNMVRDPATSVMRTFSQVPQGVQFIPSFISASQMFEGPRLLLPQSGQVDMVIAVYDDEPTSVTSYALCSKEYEDWVSDKCSQQVGSCSGKDIHREDSIVSTFVSWQSFGSLELDGINYGSYGRLL